MQCPGCHHENLTSQRFCGECGHALARSDRGGQTAAAAAHLQHEVERLARALSGRGSTVTFTLPLTSSPASHP